jgi:hypothetical protein
MTKKLRPKAKKLGVSARSAASHAASVESAGMTGTLISRASSVMAMANTASLKKTNRSNAGSVASCESDIFRPRSEKHAVWTTVVR